MILLLGTNDTETYFNRSAHDITVGTSNLMLQVATSAGGADTVITTGGIDGIHLSAQNNADLGKAVASKVQVMFGDRALTPSRVSSLGTSRRSTALLSP